MKFLGIDFGSKRVGIAISDEGGEFAFPKFTLENKKDLLEKVKKICEEEKVMGVVIGESVNQAGGYNPIYFVAKSFAKDVAAKTELPIYWEPEQMTTHHSAIGAEKGQFKKDNLDAPAAALILQRFLDKRNKKVV